MNNFLTANHQEKLSFPVDLFLSAYSCRVAVRNVIPDGFLGFPDGLRPSGKTLCLVVLLNRYKEETTK
jgi:TctA family transporter